MRPYATRRPVSWLAPLVACLALFWLVDLAGLRAGTPDPLDDSWEYGVVARSLLAGHGFRTTVVHPPLWTLRDARGAVPVLVHGPLVPVLLAPAVAIGGPRALDHVAWLAALFALLAAAQLAATAGRTHAPATGVAAAGAFTLSPLLLRAVHHDVALPLGALALAVALDRLARTRPHAVRAGLALGFGALARPEFLYALPLLAWAARGVRRRFAIAALAPVLPWLWHAYANTGSPLFNLSSYLLIGYWGARPGIDVMRDFALPPHAWPRAFAAALPALPGKWLAFFPHALKAVLTTPSPLTGWLAPLGTLLAVQSPGARAQALLWTALACLPLGIMTVTLFDPRYLVPFLPVFALAVGHGAADVVDWLPRGVRPPRVWLGVLFALLALGAGPALLAGAREGAAARARLAAERAALAAWPAPADPGRPAFSDTPDFVAWTTRRPAVWVARAQYEALPGPERATPERPARRPDDATWFHAADGRGAALPSP